MWVGPQARLRGPEEVTLEVGRGGTSAAGEEEGRRGEERRKMEGRGGGREGPGVYPKQRRDATSFPVAAS